MKSKRRAGVTKACGAVAGLGLLLATTGEARAASDAEAAAAVVVVAGFFAADVAFAVHDLDAAVNNKLAPDGWMVAQTVVTVPQTLIFNTLLVGLNSADKDIGDVATAIGVLPTAGVNALTTHGIWALTDKPPPADALAGVSVLVGMNFALSMSAIGRGVAGRFHSREIGVVETVLAAPGLGVGIYESTITRQEQPAWIALTAWSGALVTHGLISTIVDGRLSSGSARSYPLTDPTLKRAGKASSFWPQNVSVAPTVLSDGVARVPGIVAGGTF